MLKEEYFSLKNKNGKKKSPYNDFISRGAERSGGGGDATGAHVCVSVLRLAFISLL